MCGLHNADHREYCRRLIGKKTRRDSAYGLCFRMCVTKLTKLIRHLPRPREDQRISFIVESGDKNVSDALRIFQEMKNGYLTHVLGNFATASKQDYGAIQAADLIAYGAHRSLQQHLGTGEIVELSKSFAAIITSAPIEDVWVTKSHLEITADIQIAQRQGDEEAALKAFEAYAENLPEPGGFVRLPDSLKYRTE